MQHQPVVFAVKQHQIAEAGISALRRFDQDAVVVAQLRRHADTAYGEPNLRPTGQ
jgi:hypothetical protein